MVTGGLLEDGPGRQGAAHAAAQAPGSDRTRCGELVPRLPAFFMLARRQQPLFVLRSRVGGREVTGYDSAGKPRRQVHHIPLDAST